MIINKVQVGCKLSYSGAAASRCDVPLASGVSRSLVPFITNASMAFQFDYSSHRADRPAYQSGNLTEQMAVMQDLQTDVQVGRYSCRLDNRHTAFYCRDHSNHTLGYRIIYTSTTSLKDSREQPSRIHLLARHLYDTCQSGKLTTAQNDRKREQTYHRRRKQCTHKQCHDSSQHLQLIEVLA